MDFLTFDSFISIHLLIAAYYAGVVFIPLLAIANRNYLLKWIHAFEEKYGFSKRKLFLFLGLFFIIFQIVWRMMFEMIIGYFQMHDYLRQLAG